MLLELAQKRTDDATRRLGHLNKAKLNAEQQLSMLYDYRQDYLNRLQDAMSQGMSAADCQNYQRFIATLDDAISQQSTVAAKADTQLEGGRTMWQQERRKLNSFDALAQREQRSLAITEGRREQRDNDEYAAQAIRRAGHTH
jgi:flagellar FliJ protein